jgi:hypothetical protein
MKPTDSENTFASQSELFISLMVKQLGLEFLDQIPDYSALTTRSLEPIVLSDYTRITNEECALIRKAYYSAGGVAYLLALNAHHRSDARHPLFVIAERLNGSLPLSNPLDHPLEKHPEVLRHWGSYDGTVKVYDLHKPQDGSYREQGETSSAFEMHHDGLGSGGTVETVLLFCECGPVWGGFTYFQNICSLALNLAQQDRAAFKSLFLPNAVTVIRPRGKGALKVTSPVLYVNEAGRPQSAFRRSSGEYIVNWRADCEELARARHFLESHTGEFDAGSSFVRLSEPGECCLIRNEAVGHGRTRFIDGLAGHKQRCLSRKWFMRRPEDSIYKHVPGIAVDADYAVLFPSQFGPQALNGEWLYNPAMDQNELKNISE